MLASLGKRKLQKCGLCDELHNLKTILLLLLLLVVVVVVVVIREHEAGSHITGMGT